MVNNLLHHLLDEGIIVYIDDIFIKTETVEEHIQLTKKVLERFRIAGLFVYQKVLLPCEEGGLFGVQNFPRWYLNL
jgi:hypothetical protein